MTPVLKALVEGRANRQRTNPLELAVAGLTIAVVNVRLRQRETKDAIGGFELGRSLEMAKRMAALPPDIVQLNKRAVHRQMEVMGLRQGIRQGTELCSLAIHQKSFEAFISQTGAGAGKLTSALQKRDEQFGDYRTEEK